MEKTYFFATYQINSNNADSASIIKATSKSQIKRASMHLFEHYNKCGTYKEAFNFLMINVASLGGQLSYSDIKEIDVTNF